MSITGRKDRFSRAKRSEIMSRIRSKHTRLDLAMARILLKNRFKYEMYPKMEGKPDFLIRPNLIVYCDSSFWHGRNWPKLKRQLLSGSNPQYWVTHIARNRRRDRSVRKRLLEKGYKVLRFWDTEISKKPESCVSRIRKELLA
jgi:DNA mismatch endonuclease (patch repair protein)